VCVGDHGCGSSSQHYNREADIRGPLESTTPRSRALSLHATASRPLAPILPSSSPNLLSCITVVVGADMHDPSMVAILLAKHLADCDGRGFQGYPVVMTMTYLNSRKQSS
jgi:hypothetical protein